MTTFAHIETGQALDPWENTTEGDYCARFPGIDTSGWDVSEVPDGTQHGAKSDGNGGWINPAEPSPPPSPPKALTKAEFQALYAANGNDLTAALQNWPTN